MKIEKMKIEGKLRWTATSGETYFRSISEDGSGIGQVCTRYYLIEQTSGGQELWRSQTAFRSAGSDEVYGVFLTVNLNEAQMLEQLETHMPVERVLEIDPNPRVHVGHGQYVPFKEIKVFVGGGGQLQAVGKAEIFFKAALAE